MRVVALGVMNDVESLIRHMLFWVGGLASGVGSITREITRRGEGGSGLHVCSWMLSCCA